MTTPHEPGSADPARTVPPLPISARCLKCREPISPADAFCRFCGTRQHVPDPFYYHPIWILVLALTVLGPFALALVWRSRRMGPAAKAALAAIIVAYSALTFYAAYELFAILYQHFSLLNQIM
ncbi:MAG: hypothetical protein Q8N51_01305 [Gammaproteobacteria bacterium]|nr:hypothetical protein [Gammaproteobacteria bacterium]